MWAAQAASPAIDPTKPGGGGGGGVRKPVGGGGEEVRRWLLGTPEGVPGVPAASPGPQRPVECVVLVVPFVLLVVALLFCVFRLPCRLLLQKFGTREVALLLQLLF
jgi:hypothetical protein